MTRVALLASSFLLALLLLGGEVRPLGAVRVEDLGSDYGLLTWDLWAVTEAALQARSPYRTELLFHPLGADLATHTLGPGFLPVGLAVRAALRADPVYPLYAHRLSILVCFGLGMFAAQRAFRALGADELPSLAGAVGWSFAACWAPVVANQTLASACVLVPVVTLAVAALVRAPSLARVLTAACCLAGSVYLSEYFSGFIALALLTVVLTAAARGDTREGLKRLMRSLRPWRAGAALVVALLVALPFLAAWSRTEARRPGERQIHAGGANLASFVCPSPSVTPAYAGRWTSRMHSEITRGSGPFLGLATLLFAVIGAATTERRLRRVLLVLAVVFLVLSLGPTLRVFGWRLGVPLPYAVLMHLPPFDMARAPQRLAVFGIWALVSLASLGLSAVCRRVARRFGSLAAAAAALLALAWWCAEGYHPAAAAVAFSPPPALERLPPGAVANLPLSVGDGGAMFLQIFHKRPILTGYVSRISKQQYDHVERLQSLLHRDPAAFVSELRRLGVRTVILQPGLEGGVADSVTGQGLHVIDLRSGLTPRGWLVR